MSVPSLVAITRKATVLWTDDRSPILIAIAAGWFLSIGLRLTYPVLLPYIQTAYGISYTTAGILLSVLWGAYALGQLPGGILSDQIGEGNTLTLSTVIAAGMLVLVASANSILVLFVVTAAFGIGTALYGVARFTTLSQIYPDNEGTAIGVTMAAGDLGNAILPPAAGFIAGAFVWQYSIWLAVPSFLIVAIVLRLFVPARTSGATSAVDTLSLDTIRTVISEMSQPVILSVAIIQLLGYAVWQAFTGFYPTYLIEMKGLSSAAATGLFGIFFALGVGIKPLVGRAYDSYGIRRSFPIVMGTFAVAVGLLPFLDSFWSIVTLTIFLSSILGYATITLSYLTTAMPTSMQGTGLGVLRTTYMLIGAGSPILVGAAADFGFFDEAFLSLAIVSVIAVALCLRLPTA